MLKCVFVFEIWPFKSGPRRQKWGKNGGNGGGGEMGQNPQYPTTETNCRLHFKAYVKWQISTI